MKRTLILLFGLVLALGAEAADAAAEDYIALKVLNDLIDSIEPVDELVTPSTSDYVNLVGAARDAMTNTRGDDNRLVIRVEPGATSLSTRRPSRRCACGWISISPSAWSPTACRYVTCSRWSTCAWP